MFSRIKTSVCNGIEGVCVNVETDISNGLPNTHIVGLASTTVLESRARIKSAIVNSGCEYPRGRVTINLTPAGIRKNGSGLDLPIAIGILAADLYVNKARTAQFGIIGELSLAGKVLGIDGALPMVMGMSNAGIKNIIVPFENYRETKLIDGVEIIPVSSLKACIELINDGVIEEFEYCDESAESGENERNSETERCDFKDIRGQENAKRAICVAVAGRHGLLMIGSPGVGKSMLSRRIPTIMPPMTNEERIETAVIESVCGDNRGKADISGIRPFRSPHSSIGKAGLLGGGNYPLPGEISRAHNGVLFMDEVCEFSRENIEALRLPLEEKEIVHFRMGSAYRFPCDFQLVMASNPCPCGYYGDSERICKCTQAQLENYRRKLSGPIMDRIDMRIVIEKMSFDKLNSGDEGLSSAYMREAVRIGMEYARSQGRVKANALINDADIDKYCRLSREELVFMERAYDSFKLSPRSYRKILRVARTIADMNQSPDIKTEHLAEALSYRMVEEVNE